MSSLFQEAVGVEQEPDGRDTWWEEYRKESTMANDGRVSLTDSLQRNWLEKALATMAMHKGSLSQYDFDLMRKLQDGYHMVGDELTITVKQMNHIKGVAAELETGRYAS